MYVIKFPKWIVEAINSQMTNFFWNDQENNHKYHLHLVTKMPTISQNSVISRIGD
jgi:hypothetical protein